MRQPGQFSGDIGEARCGEVVSVEMWKPVPVEPFGSAYLVSNFGCIARNESGLPGRRIATTVGWSEYPTCHLSYKKKTRRALLVHRLVAMAFVDRARDDQQEVNHKDGVKTHCFATNLEWVSRAENNAHAWATGLRLLQSADGGQHHFAKLDESRVKQIKNLLSTNTNGQLAEMFGVHKETISRIRRGVIWKRVVA